MSEATKDPAIKLFGRTIPLSDGQQSPATDTEERDKSVKGVSKEIIEVEGNSPTTAQPEENNENEAAQVDLDGRKSTNEDKETSTNDNKEVAETNSEETKSEADGSTQEKVLKKPDKILPCPRCNSMDTKFCYYNNYNVNQPRHFCKNCQRYWTAGGTMRNVPVGAGRRKSKHSASQYRQIMMPPDGLQPLRIDVPDFPHHQAIPCGPQNPIRPLTPNGTVIKFGSEVPLCESMVSVLNLKEQNKIGDYSSGACRESKEDPSSASSVTTPDRREIKRAENPVNTENNGPNGYSNGVTPLPHFQYYPGAPWPYPWNPGWQNVASMPTSRCSSEFACRPEHGNSNPIPWMAPPAFCPPPIPFPFVPASFWGCLSSWPNAAWNPPWVASNGVSNGVTTPTSSASHGSSGNGSPTLGKHSRDAGLGEEKTEKSLWVPKTLRIDDPDEAAKSSIWATLGIKPDEKSLFKPFQSKSQIKSQTPDAAKVLHANPAALSRSQSFQEST